MINFGAKFNAFNHRFIIECDKIEKLVKDIVIKRPELANYNLALTALENAYKVNQKSNEGLKTSEVLAHWIELIDDGKKLPFEK